MVKKCEGKSKTFRRNLVLASVSIALAALTFGWDNLNGKVATAEDLAPPPLLWEAQPEPRKPDNTYYHKKKAQQQQQQQQSQRRMAQEPAHGGPQQVQGGAEPGSAMAPSMTPPPEGGISAEEYQRNLDAREQPDSDMIGDGEAGAPGVSEGYPGDDAEPSDAMDKRAPTSPLPPQEACNYNHFVGKNIKDIDFSLFGKRPTRVIYPNQAVTMDYSSSRINFEVEQSGKITRVACY